MTTTKAIKSALLQARSTPATSLQDADSLAEAARIDAPGYAQDRICLRHLRKVYNTRPPKVRLCSLCAGTASVLKLRSHCKWHAILHVLAY